MAVDLTPEQTGQIADAIAAGNKIAAIKLYRQVSGSDLKSSKEFIEKLSTELHAKDPVRYPIASGKGCLVTLIAIVALASISAIVWWL